MKGTVIDGGLIEADEGGRYGFDPQDVAGGLEIGDRVRFRTQGEQATNIFIINEPTFAEQPNNADKSAPDFSEPQAANHDTQRAPSDDMLKASADYEMLKTAKFQGCVSILLPVAANILFLIFNIQKSDVVDIVLHIAGLGLSYLAIRNIARLADNDEIDLNFAKGATAIIALELASIAAGSLISGMSALSAKLLLVAAAIVLIYAALMFIKSFIRLADVARNALFRHFVFLQVAGNVLFLLDWAIIGSILMLASAVIYLFAWLKTDSIADDGSEVYIY